MLVVSVVGRAFCVACVWCHQCAAGYVMPLTQWGLEEEECHLSAVLNCEELNWEWRPKQVLNLRRTKTNRMLYFCPQMLQIKHRANKLLLYVILGYFYLREGRMYAYTRVCVNTHASSANVLLSSKKPCPNWCPSSFVPASSDRFAPNLREIAFGYHCL